MRTITISLMLLLVVVVSALSITIAGWDYDESLGPDIIDGLMQIPPHVKKQYGGTNKERVVYNIAELLVTRNDHTARIKALEQLVKELEAQVAAVEQQVADFKKPIRITVHPDDLPPFPYSGQWDPNEVK